MAQPRPVFSPFDERMMVRAIQLAKRGAGRVEPNPMVGCVIARGDHVVGEGYHRRFGGPHAEVEALRVCGGKAHGATAYVTLEPCCHYGQTPPCVDALREAGLARVVIPFADPHRLVRGKGIDRLRRAGMRVDVGLKKNAAADLIAPFATRILRNRPYVIAKWAQSLDGKWATRHGESRWISGEESRRMVHRLRARMDAIVVGSGTVLIDDPLLTARGVTLRRRATRVVMDGRIRIPEQCQLIDTVQEAPVWLISSPEASASRKAHRLRRKGVEVIAVRTSRGRPSLSEALRILAKRDCTNVLVEGGPALTGAFLSAGLVDEAMIFLAPMIVGDSAAPALTGHRSTVLVPDEEDQRVMEIRRYGADVLLHLKVNQPPWP